MTEDLRVLLVDDHPVYRDGLRILLDTVPGLEVAGVASSGEEAVRICSDELPDVVVMDLNMPGMNGVEATRAITRAHPSVGVLVLTMHDDDESVFAAVQAGARGYLLKGADQAQIERAVRTVASGEVVFGQALATRIAAYFNRPSTPVTGLPGLTRRENEILALVARGRNNRVIADELVLSEKTVRNHVSNIFTKLQVADRAEAIVRARDSGIGGR